MKILWDEPKRLSNLKKHGLDFADLAEAFFEGALKVPARQPRRKAVGRFRDDIIAVIYAEYGDEAVSIVSMRPANRDERMPFYG